MALTNPNRRELERVPFPIPSLEAELVVGSAPGTWCALSLQSEAGVQHLYGMKPLMVLRRPKL